MLLLLLQTLGLTSCVKKTNTVGSSTGNDTLVKVDTTKVDTTKSRYNKSRYNKSIK